jgi:hypothetical protein
MLSRFIARRETVDLGYNISYLLLLLIYLCKMKVIFASRLIQSGNIILHSGQYCQPIAFHDFNDIFVV